MSTQSDSLQEKKLKNLRKILWIVFGCITATVLLCGGLAMPVFLLVNRTPELYAPSGVTPGMLLIALLVGMLVLIGVVGTICLVIYFTFRYRLEKDEELFL